MNKWMNNWIFILFIILFFGYIFFQIYYNQKKENERKNLMFDLDHQIRILAKKKNEYTLSDEDVFELLTNYENFENRLYQSQSD